MQIELTVLERYSATIAKVRMGSSGKLQLDGTRTNMPISTTNMPSLQNQHVEDVPSQRGDWEPFPGRADGIRSSRN